MTEVFNGSIFQRKWISGKKGTFRFLERPLVRTLRYKEFYGTFMYPKVNTGRFKLSFVNRLVLQYVFENL